MSINILTSCIDVTHYSAVRKNLGFSKILGTEIRKYLEAIYWNKTNTLNKNFMKVTECVAA